MRAVRANIWNCVYNGDDDDDDEEGVVQVTTVQMTSGGDDDDRETKDAERRWCGCVGETNKSISFLP